MTDITRSCPNCAAAISINARWTRLAVCQACQSAVTFDDGVGSVRGTLSILPPSRTSLFVGAQGALSGRPFEVLGRVRYGWARGYWDEWHLLWTDDGSTGWLSEDEERLVLETLLPGAPVPFNARAALGSVSTIKGEAFSVTERGVGLVEGGEGQLPFQLIDGEVTPFVELKSTDGTKLASAEFGLGHPRLFVGTPVDLAALDMPWTRQELGIEGDLPLASAADGSVPRIQSLSGGLRSLKCVSCGGGLEVASDADGRLPDAVACAYCSAANTLSGKAVTCPNCTQPVQTNGGDAKLAHCKVCDHQIDLRGEAASLGEAGPESTPWFGLGSMWRFEDVDYTVTGMLRFDGFSDGEAWHYWEYCLFEKSVGYCWLVHSDDTWTLATRVFDHPPLGPDDGSNAIIYRDKGYEVKEDNRVTLTYVAGELPWVARKGDTVRALDTAPRGGQSLSIEWGPDEVQWYLCRRVIRDCNDSGDITVGKEVLSPYWVRHVLVMLFVALLAGGGLWLHLETRARGGNLTMGDLSGATIADGGGAFGFTTSESAVRLALFTPYRANASLEGAWVHYTIEVKASDGSVAETFTATHTDFWQHSYHGYYTYVDNRRTGAEFALEPGTYSVNVVAETGLVDGSRTSPVAPPLEYSASWSAGSYDVTPFMAWTGLLVLCILLMGTYVLEKGLMSFRRAKAPKVPWVTIVCAVALMGSFYWGAPQRSPQPPLPSLRPPLQRTKPCRTTRPWRKQLERNGTQPARSRCATTPPRGGRTPVAGIAAASRRAIRPTALDSRHAP